MTTSPIGHSTPVTRDLVPEGPHEVQKGTGAGSLSNTNAGGVSSDPAGQPQVISLAPTSDGPATPGAGKRFSSARDMLKDTAIALPISAALRQLSELIIKSKNLQRHELEERKRRAIEEERARNLAAAEAANKKADKIGGARFVELGGKLGAQGMAGVGAMVEWRGNVQRAQLNEQSANLTNRADDLLNDPTARAKAGQLRLRADDAAKAARDASRDAQGMTLRAEDARNKAGDLAGQANRFEQHGMTGEADDLRRQAGKLNRDAGAYDAKARDLKSTADAANTSAKNLNEQATEITQEAQNRGDANALEARRYQKEAEELNRAENKLADWSQRYGKLNAAAIGAVSSLTAFHGTGNDASIEGERAKEERQKALGKVAEENADNIKKELESALGIITMMLTEIGKLEELLARNVSFQG